MRVAHGASEYLGTRPFETEAIHLTIVVAPKMWLLCAWLG
jgi:hypothetical protein